MKKTKIYGKLFRPHRLEELILLNCSYYPKQSADLVQSHHNSNDIFHRIRTNNSKICTGTTKTLNKQSNLKIEQARSMTLPYFQLYCETKVIKKCDIGINRHTGMPG